MQLNELYDIQFFALFFYLSLSNQFEILSCLERGVSITVLLFSAISYLGISYYLQLRNYLAFDHFYLLFDDMTVVLT